MKKIFIVLLIIIASSCMPAQNSEPVNPADDSTKTFSLIGGNFWFEMENVKNPEIRVNQGDKIRIEFRSIEGFHDFVIDDLDAATARVIETDGSVFVDLIADKKGNFEYYCSVDSHREYGMKGNFIVE